MALMNYPPNKEVTSVDTLLNKVIGEKKNELELEVKYSMTKTVWERFRIKMDLEQTPIVTVDIVSYHGPDVRQIAGQSVGQNVKIFQKKETIAFYFNRDYDYKVTLSREIIIKPVQIKEGLKRQRTRYRYTRKDSNNKDVYYIDMTIVHVYGKEPNENIYEFEVEFANPNIKLEAFNEIVKRVRMEFLGTKVDYTNKEAKVVKDSLDKILKPDGNSRTHNGIVNAFPLNKNSLSFINFTEYSVAAKADGFRKILFVFNGKLWMMFGEELNLLGDITDPSIYVITGELCKPDKYNPLVSNIPNLQKKSLFVVDDELYAGMDLRKKKYEDRLKHMYSEIDDNTSIYDKKIMKEKFSNPVYGEIIQLLHDNDILFVNKPIPKIKSFTRDNESILSNEYLFGIDGLVFTYNGVYNPTGPRLTPVYKWKPPHLTSIDFLVMKSGNTNALKYRSNGEEKVFRGSSKYPFSGVVLADPKLNYRNGGVYSFLPGVYDPKVDISDETNDYGFSTIASGKSNFKMNLDYKPNIKEYLRQVKASGNRVPEGRFVYLYFERYRSDKNFPNHENVIMSNWDSINEPLTEETITGKNMELVFSYHKRVKSDLLPALVENKVVLDIGFGQGGDIGRYSGAKKVYGIEPNPNNIDIARKRIQSYKDIPKDKYKLFQYYGTDSEEIAKAINTKVDVVVMMLSATFFWESAETLRKLIKTIQLTLKPDGKWVIFTLDGNKIGPLFKDVEWSKESIKCNQCEPEARSPRRKNIEFVPNDISPKTPRGHQTDTVMSPRSIIKKSQRDTPKESPQNPSLPEGKRYKRIYFGPGYIDLFSSLNSGIHVGEKIEITLPGSRTVEGAQTEYLVNLNDLVKAGFNLETTRLPPSYIIPDEQLLLSQSYTWAVLTPKDIKIENIVTPHKPQNKEKLGMLPSNKIIGSLMVSWTDEEVYRINTIGDGSCFVHSFLTAFYPLYQDADDKTRKEIASEFRKELSESLTANNNQYPGYNYWSTSGNGMFLNQYLMEKFMDFDTDFPFKGDLKSVEKFLDSTSWLGQEAIHYITDVTNIAIIVVTGYKCTGDKSTCNQIAQTASSVIKNDPRKIVIIVQVDNHYETIGVMRNNKLQTVFESNDPFVVELGQGISFHNLKANPVGYVLETLTELSSLNMGDEIEKLPKHDLARKAYEVWKKSQRR